MGWVFLTLFSIGVLLTIYWVSRAVHEYTTNLITVYYFYDTTGKRYGPFKNLREALSIEIEHQRKKTGGHYEVTRATRHQLNSNSSLQRFSHRITHIHHTFGDSP